MSNVGNEFVAHKYLELAHIAEEQKEYEEAVALFKKAAENDCAEAMHALFKCYFDGIGVPVNRQIARLYLEVAVALGDKIAKEDLDYLNAQMC